VPYITLGYVNPSKALSLTHGLVEVCVVFIFVFVVALYHYFA